MTDHKLLLMYAVKAVMTETDEFTAFVAFGHFDTSAFHRRDTSVTLRFVAQVMIANRVFFKQDTFRGRDLSAAKCFPVMHFLCRCCELRGGGKSEYRKCETEGQDLFHTVRF